MNIDTSDNRHYPKGGAGWEIWGILLAAYLFFFVLLPWLNGL